MKSALALVIGLNDYETLTKLDNAVSDAKLISESLENLGFIVIRGYDMTIREIDGLVEEFCSALTNYDLGLFYFAGHGFQIDGENLLAGKEINAFSLTSAKRDSILLEDLIKKMDRSGVNAKVVILDACRKPIEGVVRGSEGNDFAPVFAPKGTLIAFSTSPGEAAKDGIGNNSYYTLAFVQHLKQEDIEIELFFKRVRATVSSATQGAQTSWEHTSLIGPLILNSGQLRHSKNLPYSDTVIADYEFKTVNSGSAVDLLLAALSGDFHKQNEALDKIPHLSLNAWSDDQLFLLGRGLVNAGENHSNSGIAIYRDLKNWLIGNAGARAHHIVSGMFFEIYFNGHGLFRKSALKQKFLKEVIDLQGDVRFRESFVMINDQLRPFSDRLLYRPGPDALSLPVDLTIGRLRDESGRPTISAVNVHGVNITNTDIEEEYSTRLVTKDELLSLLSKELMVPQNKITLNPELSDSQPVSIPYSYRMQRATLDLFKEENLEETLEL
ncbi:caspase family protein [Mucilaginibacter kameinonensis]|uniref:caspase family protein n=1 Tax=Mucilaginibacter kameinonensis TaxID=452286 RepID=UPI000EF76312|nr:caspase family protein [Mucilaginibacter kameinonensis]